MGARGYLRTVFPTAFRTVARALALASGLATMTAAAAHAQPSPPAGQPTPIAQPAGRTIGGPKLASSGLIVDPQAPPLPAVKAKTFVVADLDSGQILAARGPHVRLPPASTLKILTADTLLPRLHPEQPCTATAEDAAIIGSRAGVVPGQRYRADDLFRAMMMVSGNDAAYVLARCAGGVPQTVRLMQEEAHRLQAYDTTVVNPCGLDEPGQLSSAYDLALLGRAGMARQDFRGYVGVTKAPWPGKGGKPESMWNRNRLFYRYHGRATVIGVKNGYTTQARHTLVGAARQGDRTLIVSLMQGDRTIYEDAGRLLDWGFAASGKVHPVGQLVEPLPRPGLVSGDGSGERRAGGPGVVAQSRGERALGWLGVLLGAGVFFGGAAVLYRLLTRVSQKP
ncbi:D-alanyl-D-alanine carboxypeptidase [Carbonactinospora thermoautotrophica]|nr:D-alanyl-D-alanine carboxypeptidase [Carbonactinospora thermoautotrophica]